MYVRKVQAKPVRRRVHTVQEVTRIAKGLLDRSLSSLWVSGEISNLRCPSSGHVYLTLKDERSQLPAVLWRTAAKRIPFRLEDGLEVIVYGRLTVYEPRGQYQMVLEEIEPKGIGAAQLALEQLKQRLAREGLFDPRRKRPLPRFPQAIALVTSATGAAVRDMLEVIDRRYPCVRVILRPVRVQGQSAAAEVAAAVRALSRHGVADVVIVGRGGGSKEDLWAFNDEDVARAIVAAPMPVISSVGHAIDTTIADLVADCRALTPTEAAELATPVLADLLQHLLQYRSRLGAALLRSVRGARERLDLVGRSYAFREPKERIRRHQQRLDEISLKLPREAQRTVRSAREHTDRLAEQLHALSPLRVLSRGFSVTVREGTTTPLVRAEELSPGDLIVTQLEGGEVLSEVQKVRSTDTHTGTDTATPAASEALKGDA